MGNQKLRRNISPKSQACGSHTGSLQTLHESYAGEGVSNHNQLFTKMKAKTGRAFGICYCINGTLTLSETTRAESTLIYAENSRLYQLIY